MVTAMTVPSFAATDVGNTDDYTTDAIDSNESNTAADEAANTNDYGINTLAWSDTLSPDVKSVATHEWYYYINGSIDYTYNGLATNQYGTWWIENGYVTFSYDKSFNGGGAGGWKLEDSELVKGSKLSISESMGSCVEDDNSFSGRLIVGDSRCVQLYNFDPYYQASFSATYGGRYTDYTYTITGSGKLETMKTYAKESLECLGYCDVYLFSSINDTADGNTAVSTGTGWEISAAQSLADVSATFNGTTVHPTIHIVGLINTNTNNSHYVTTTYLNNWNNALISACSSNGWEYLDYTSCLGSNNNGYADDNIHYGNETLMNIWYEILNNCPHEYHSYPADNGGTNHICIKCGDVYTDGNGTPSLHISKYTEHSGSFDVGDEVWYWIDVGNGNTDSTAQNVVVSDTLPDGLELLEVRTSKGTANIDGNSFTVTYDSMPGTPAEYEEIVVGATITKIGEITNTAYIDADNATKASNSCTINATSDLEITKTAGKDTYNPGDYVPYTITVTPTKSGTYSNVVVTDTLPNGLMLTDDPMISDVSGATESATSGSFQVTIPTLSYGQTATITFEAQLYSTASGTSITNTAYASADGIDKVSASSTISIASVSPTLTITKTADKSTYNVGDTVTYTIKASETVYGATANNVVISDSLPSGLELVDVTASNSGTVSKSGNGFTVNYDSVTRTSTGGYETRTVTVTATALESGSITNTATVKSDETSQKSDSATIDVASSGELSISKKADTSIHSVGDTVTYTITVQQKDEGITVDNVVVTDALPSGLTLTGTPSVSGVSGGSVSTSGNTVTANISSLSYGDTATITVKAVVGESVASSNVTNTATVKADSVSEKSASATISIASAFGLSKIADKDTYTVGDTITYTITLNATSSVDAPIFYDELPDEISFRSLKSATVNGENIPSYMIGVYTWSGGGIMIESDSYFEAGDVVEIVYTCKADKAETDVTNYVTLNNDTVSATVNIVEETAECTHQNYTTKVTEPTCTEGGYTKYTCSDCGYEWVSYETDALGHSYKDTVTEPTCTKGGYTTHTCTRCNDSYTDSETDALGHDYKDIITEPTCTEGGYTTHTCTRCNDSYTDSETDALGHKYVATTVEPTCTKEGYISHKCSVCGDTYEDDYVDALGHEWSDEPDIEKVDGMNVEIHTFTCKRCDETYVVELDYESAAVGESLTVHVPLGLSVKYSDDSVSASVVEDEDGFIYTFTFKQSGDFEITFVDEEGSVVFVYDLTVLADDPGDTDDPDDQGGTGGTSDPDDQGGTGGTDDPDDQGGTGGTSDPDDQGGTGGTSDPDDQGGTGGDTDNPDDQDGNTGDTDNPDDQDGNTGDTNSPDDQGGNTGDTSDPDDQDGNTGDVGDSGDSDDGTDDTDNDSDSTSVISDSGSNDDSGNSTSISDTSSDDTLSTDTYDIVDDDGYVDYYTTSDDGATYDDSQGVYYDEYADSDDSEWVLDEGEDSTGKGPVATGDEKNAAIPVIGFAISGACAALIGAVYSRKRKTDK